MIKHNLLSTAICLSLLMPLPANALGGNGIQHDENEPALIKADSLRHNKDNNVVTASGNVEVVQGKRILMADTIEYYQETDTIIAKGNVSLLEKDANVYFADEVKLSDEMTNGIIQNFKVRLSDGSLMAANKAVMTAQTKYELDEAVYSPCSICNEDGKQTTKNPLWQVKAKKVTVDNNKEQITYNHSFFEVYGVPLAYSPYLSHPTPDAKRKSGILTPLYGSLGTLGSFAEIPYYVDIKPNMDATISPVITSEEGPILKGEFRHLTANGHYTLFGSITRPQNLNDEGQPISGRTTRGHIEGAGHFNLGNKWQAGFAAKRSSDDTYLKRYDLGDEDDLTTRVYTRRLWDQNFVNIQGLSFQGLQQDDDPGLTPLVLPYITAYYERAAGNNGEKWLLDVSSSSLTRDEGADSSNLSVTGGWTKPYITPNGHVFTAKASLRGDVYYINDVQITGSSELETGIEKRIMPQAELQWSYPLIATQSRHKILFEPIANAIVSPYGNNPEEIPNEDSIEIEFSDHNLFSDNRFTGIDRVEEGSRFNYGFRSTMQTERDETISVVFGQSYRPKIDDSFDAFSGLDDNFSDYVGRISLQKGSFFDTSYRFRIDKDDLVSNRNEVTMDLQYKPLKLNIDYLSLDENVVGDSTREEIFASTIIDFNKVWSFSADGRRDLSAGGGMIYSGANLFYYGDCIDFTLSMFREFTRDRDIEPSTSVTFQISLKNLS